MHLARIVLLNPNTTAALTDLMVEIAREVAAAGLSVEGLTAPFGPPGGDPQGGLGNADHWRSQHLGERVGTGIAEGGDNDGNGGRRFMVVTHTGRLAERMARRAREIGLEANCVGVQAREGDPATLMVNEP